MPVLSAHFNVDLDRINERSGIFLEVGIYRVFTHVRLFHLMSNHVSSVGRDGVRLLFFGSCFGWPQLYHN